MTATNTWEIGFSVSIGGSNNVRDIPSILQTRGLHVYNPSLTDIENRFACFDVLVKILNKEIILPEDNEGRYWTEHIDVEISRFRKRVDLAYDHARGKAYCYLDDSDGYYKIMYYAGSNGSYLAARLKAN